MPGPKIYDQPPDAPEQDTIEVDFSTLPPAPWNALGSRGPDGIWRLHLSAQEVADRGGLAILLPEQIEAIVQTIFRQQAENMQAHGLRSIDPEAQLEKVRRHIAALSRITPGELHASLDARERQVEAGRAVGQARKGTRPAARKHKYWVKLAAERCPWGTPRQAAVNVTEYLAGVERVGKAPKFPTVYEILLKDNSWRTKRQNR